MRGPFYDRTDGYSEDGTPYIEDGDGRQVCHGFSDDLSEVRQVADALNSFARVTRQRDAAVEALRRILGLQEEYDGESFETTFLAAENIARAALALCEEKP